MNNLAEKLNMQIGEVEGAYIVRKGGDASSAICAITHGNYQEGYDEAIDVLEAFMEGLNDDTGHTVSVWLD